MTEAIERVGDVRRLQTENQELRGRISRAVEILEDACSTLSHGFAGTPTGPAKATHRLIHEAREMLEGK